MKHAHVERCVQIILVRSQKVFDPSPSSHTTGKERRHVTLSPIFSVLKTIFLSPQIKPVSSQPLIVIKVQKHTTFCYTSSVVHIPYNAHEYALM